MDVDLQACIRGDRAAWEAFVQRYSGVIYASVRRTMGVGTSTDELDDAVQDVFVRLVQRDFKLLAAFDPERASMPTWLTLVARSAAIDRLRKKKRQATSTLVTEPEDVVPDEPQTGPEIPLQILTARQRLVLRLLFDDDRTVTEAATILDVDEQTIRSTKHKALARLRKHFSDAAS